MEKIVKLHKWEMTDGILERIEVSGDLIRIELDSGSLFLPYKLKGRLYKLLGKKVGILRTDIPGKEFLVTEVGEMIKSNFLRKIYIKGRISSRS